jgi:hypothetical protein
MSTDRSLTVGSLGAMAKQNNTSLAESFISADLVVIVDVSSSMGANDSRGGRDRYSVACDELAALQRTMPGRIAVIAFSTDVEFVPGGVPPFAGGSTNLAKALHFAHVADVPGMRFVVISDGEPDNESEALAVARTYQNRIDVVYVGPEIGARGRDFLGRLAKASGGTIVTAARAQELAASVQALLLSA